MSKKVYCKKLKLSGLEPLIIDENSNFINVGELMKIAILSM